MMLHKPIPPLAVFHVSLSPWIDVPLDIGFDERCSFKIPEARSISWCSRHTQQTRDLGVYFEARLWDSVANNSERYISSAET